MFRCAKRFELWSRGGGIEGFWAGSRKESFGVAIEGCLLSVSEVWEFPSGLGLDFKVKGLRKIDRLGILH